MVNDTTVTRNKKRNRFFNKLSFRLLVPYFFVSCAALSIFSVLVYYNYSTQISSIRGIQEEIALRASAEIDCYIREILDGLSLTGKNINCIDCSEENRNTLQYLIDENPSIYKISLLDDKGSKMSEVSRFDSENSSVFSEENLINDVLTLTAGEKEYFGPVYISEYGLPFLPIALPLFDENDVRTGVLITEVDLSPMWNTVSKIQMKESGYVYVVDQEGDILAYRNIGLVKEHRSLANIRGVRNFLQNIHPSGIYDSFTNQRVIGDWHAVGIVGWGLIVELPYDEVLQSFRPLIIAAGLSLLLFGISIILMLAIIFRILLSPIKKLQRGVTEIESGHLDKVIDTDSSDEIGDLADAFNGMVLRLKEYYSTLEQKVSDRTKELESTKEDLRTQLIEVEQLNKAMIDRELKMIEMKKEMAELRKKTGTTIR